ncbi:MAG: hypothetical protein L6437_05905 [Kiritimatiellae bacterium]|nr:hypothetical protein [Kiritimatiellia bacterium]
MNVMEEKVNILLVDDNDSNLDTLKAVLDDPDVVVKLQIRQEGNIEYGFDIHLQPKPERAGVERR